jgi:hypothetical protein
MTNTNKTVAKTKHPSYLCGQPQSDPYPALRALCARDSRRVQALERGFWNWLSPLPGARLS